MVMSNKSGDFRENKLQDFRDSVAPQNFSDDRKPRDLRGDSSAPVSDFRGDEDEGTRDLRGDSSTPDSKDWRETMVAAVNKKRQETADKQGKIAKTLAKSVSPIRKSTSKLLRQAWLNVIDSCGLTLLWVLAHWELNKLFGKDLFCPYGYEWADAVPEKGVEGKMTEATSNFLNKVESAGVGCLVMVILFGIITFLLFLCIIINKERIIIELTWEAIKASWGAIF